MIIILSCVLIRDSWVRVRDCEMKKKETLGEGMLELKFDLVFVSYTSCWLITTILQPSNISSPHTLPLHPIPYPFAPYLSLHPYPFTPIPSHPTLFPLSLRTLPFFHYPFAPFYFDPINPYPIPSHLSLHPYPFTPYSFAPFPFACYLFFHHPFARCYFDRTLPLTPTPLSSFPPPPLFIVKLPMCPRTDAFICLSTTMQLTICIVFNAEISVLYHQPISLIPNWLFYDIDLLSFIMVG